MGEIYKETSNISEFHASTKKKVNRYVGVEADRCTQGIWESEKSPVGAIREGEQKFGHAQKSAAMAATHCNRLSPCCVSRGGEDSEFKTVLS